MLLFGSGGRCESTLVSENARKRERIGNHLVLRAGVLHRDADARWDVGEPDRRFSFVDVLGKVVSVKASPS